MNGSEGMTLPQYFEGVKGGLTQAGNTIANLAGQVQAGIQQGVAQAMAAGMTQEQAMQLPQIQQLVAQGQQLKTAGESLQATGDQLNASAETLAPYANGMNLKSDQSGWGIAPVLGIDYKIGNFNFAAKYEFKTRMRMKNDSDLKEATVISATNKYVNGSSVPEDSPAQLALGAQWEPTEGVRVNLGYHHFFDKSAHWYEHSEKLLDGDTNEYLAGAEWDITKKLQVSGGVQLTRYGLSDAYMNDMSFVVNSWTFGLGVGYQVTDKVKINAAYFQTNYENYDMDTPQQNMAALGLTIPAGKNSFTRTNRVVGIGVELTL
jgi:long-subunit fatty acid transport protein